MTIICGLYINDFPVLLGDVLLTTGIKNINDDLTLPITGKLPDNFSQEFGFSVSRLRQKVNIIDDKVIVAWAGAMIQATAMIRDIRDLVKEHSPSIEKMRELIQSINPEDKSDLAMIIFVQEDDKLYYYWDSTKAKEQKFIKGIRYAGTGSPYLEKTLDAMDSATEVDEGAPDYVHSLGTALTIASQAVGREYYSGQNILERWGGIIELGFVLGQKAQKLNNIMYCHVRYAHHEGLEFNDFSLAPKIVKAEYFENFLYCRTMEFRQDANAKDAPYMFLADENVTVIPPILYDGVSKIKNYTPSLTYDFLCTHLSYEIDGKPSWSSSFVDFCGDGRKPLVIEKFGEKFRVAMTSRLGDRLRSAIESYRNDQPQ